MSDLELDQPPSHSSGQPAPSGTYASRMQGELKMVREPQNAKEKFLETLLTGKNIALELVDDFRASDRFFKYKAGVLAAWLLMSAATFVIACPSADSGPSNSLGAVVLVQQVATLDRTITAVLIENTSSEDWGDLMVKLNNVYVAAIPGVQAGRKAVVQLDKFTSSESKTPPASLQPQLIELRCNQGEATVDLRPKQ